MTQRGDIPESALRWLQDAAAEEARARRELRAAIGFARKSGGSVRAIAGTLGVSPGTIQRWLQEIGNTAPAAGQTRPHRGPHTTDAK